MMIYYIVQRGELIFAVAILSHAKKVYSEELRSTLLAVPSGLPK